MMPETVNRKVSKSTYVIDYIDIDKATTTTHEEQL